MATEAPLIRDGSQCQAAANYWNPGSALFGPAGSGQFLAVTLTGTTARLVTLVTASTQMVYGILQNSPDINQAADVGIFGVSKAVSGATTWTNIGTKLMADTN